MSSFVVTPDQWYVRVCVNCSSFTFSAFLRFLGSKSLPLFSKETQVAILVFSRILQYLSFGTEGRVGIRSFINTFFRSGMTTRLRTTVARISIGLEECYTKPFETKPATQGTSVLSDTLATSPGKLGCALNMSANNLYGLKVRLILFRFLSSW